jgi:acetyltransferase-like isoleucine patch superfamily enzyme
MFNSLRSKILKNQSLLSLTGFLSQLIFFIFFRQRINGRDNSIEIHKTTLFLKGNIIIKGSHNKLIIQKNCRLKKVRIEILGNSNMVEISESVMFYEGSWLCIEGDHCLIQIGTKTTIGQANIFCGESNTRIEIGKDCMFSRNIRMNTSDSHSIVEKESFKRINPPKNIIIGNHVWVGNGVSIMKGATIGTNSVIASSSLVDGKSYGDHTILGGLPAKVIKENINWTREKLS